MSPILVVVWLIGRTSPSLYSKEDVHAIEGGIILQVWQLLPTHTLTLTLSLSPHAHTQVARCTKIIDADSDHPKYVIHVKQFAKFVVNLHKNLAPTDVEEGMKVGYVPSH